MKLHCIVFTKAGECLAEKLLPRLDGWQTGLACGFGTGKTELGRWAEAAFRQGDALLFIGAAGIAVRAIAPLVKTKTDDPAVLVMDEAGRWVIPLLSGHIGGANRLAKTLAALCGGQAVLTTATDVQGLWAVDEWAAQNGIGISNPEKIKAVSARLLRGETVLLYSDMELLGTPPKGVAVTEDRDAADVVLSPFCCGNGKALHLLPPCVSAGVGCRKGAGQKAIDALFAAALAKAGVLPGAVGAVHTINLKENEPGLLAFCKALGKPLITHSAQALGDVQGSRSPSGFVQSVTGVDNVCERSALVGGGELLLPKQAGGGVTVALAIQKISYSFGGA